MWWIIATLIILGVLCLVAELLLIPGVGIAGILGVISLVASCWYGYTFMSPAVGTTVTIINIALVVIAVVVALRGKTWKKFELSDEIRSHVEDRSSEIAVGSKGETVTRLAPMGTAKFGSVTLEVKSSDNNMIDPKTAVEAVGREDGKILVKPLISE